MLETMPPPKKKPNQPKRVPNPNAVFVRLDDETGAALAKFVAAQKVPPERTAVIVIALRQFLAAEGYLKS